MSMSAPRAGTSSRRARGDRKSTRLNSSHTVIYTLSLHDALPICLPAPGVDPAIKNAVGLMKHVDVRTKGGYIVAPGSWRSEEHTSELQSHRDLHSFPTRRSSDLLASAGRRSGYQERGRADEACRCPHQGRVHRRAGLV